MNILKKATSKALLSLTLATTLFFSPNINGSTAHAGVGPISYSIDHEITRNFSEIEEKYNNNFSNKTVILTTNDVHGAVDGYPYLAGMKDYFGKLGADVIVVDAGDFSETKTEPGQKKEIYITPKNGLAFKCMNSVGYNYATIGNHEGITLGDLDKNGKEEGKKPTFKIISSNILKPSSTLTNISEYDEKANPLFTSRTIHKTAIEDADNVNIGFFGLTTKDAKSSKSKMLLEEDMQKCAQYQCDKLKTEGADIVICLAHLGLEDEFAERGESSYTIYRNVNPIDLMIDGHSHSIITPPEYGKPLIYKKENGDDVNNDPILSTGKQFENIGVVVIDNHKKAIEDAFLVERDVFENFGPINPENNDAAAATAEVVEAVKKESKNSSKKQ